VDDGLALLAALLLAAEAEAPTGSSLATLPVLMAFSGE
jgi:hypothetical protein